MAQVHPLSTPAWHRAGVKQLLCLLALLLAVQPCLAVSQPLKIGAYHNPPKILLDESGTPAGIFIDVLQTIADAEGWQVEMVPCDWEHCLTLLDSGAIDLMPDVALSSARSERFGFHTTPVLLSWSQVYEGPGTRLHSLLDMGGKRVAVLRGSIQQDYLRQLAESFDLQVDWVEVSEPEEGFAAVQQGKADAVATNHFLGDQMAQQLGLNPAPILFQPSKLFFAARPGLDPAILQRIDHHLQQWQQNDQSPLNHILQRWGIEAHHDRIPPAMWWAVGALVAALLLALALSQLLRRKVAAQTRSLRESEQRLNTILDSVEALIYIKGRDLRYQYANRNTCNNFGVSQHQLIGKQDSDLLTPDEVATVLAHDLRVLEQGERVAVEERLHGAGSPEQRMYFSVKLPLRDEQGEIYALCGISTDITDYRRIQDQLHQLAYYDPLTSLPNRRMLLERLRLALADRDHLKNDGALMLIDLHNFKQLNDTLGHAVGDQLLQQVAQRLSHHLHSTDTVARLSGDEFVLLMPHLHPDPQHAALQAHHMTQRLLDDLAQPFQLQNSDYLASACIGVALFSDSGMDADTLLRNADLALTEAKLSGRNTHRFFNPSMQVEVNRRSQLETALRLAIAHNDLQLFIQPQWHQDGSVIGAEALVRWPHKEKGWISPGDFIPIAETSGLIVPLGEWVLEQACVTLARWQTIPALASLVLAINISPRQFRHNDFVNQVENCVTRHRIDPSRLELEITESLLIDDVEQTIARMNQLRQHGIRFSLDDFGTGYASLGYLKRLPLFQLKIDQSFVRDLLTDSNDEAIVRTIIALGHGMDLAVIAEGVETAEQADHLRKLGCDSFQGYFFGRPAAIPEWEGKLADRPAAL